MHEPAIEAFKTAPSRACGTCTLCCKVYDIAALAKPMGQWCRHCEPARGCRIHPERPEQCRVFDCLWLTAPWMGEEWKPERSKMVLTLDTETRFLLVQVDAGAPTAWKREPYYAQLKRWAAAAARERRHVVVFVNRLATVVLPDRDVPVGVIEPGDRIVARERRTPNGVVVEVEKVRAAA